MNTIGSFATSAGIVSISIGSLYCSGFTEVNGGTVLFLIIITYYFMVIRKNVNTKNIF